jgi:AraC-like DNA-binding protein
LLLIEPSLLEREWGSDRPFQSLHFSEGQLKSEQALERHSLLCSAIESPDSSPLELAHRLREFVEVTWRHACEGPPKLQASGCERAVRRAREYIEDNYADSISLDDLAEVVGLSKFHMDRSFKEKIGVPLHEYQTRVRIARSLELLRQGIRPAHASQAVGFVDQSHMHRVFREQLGFTPGYYASRVAGRPHPAGAR